MGTSAVIRKDTAAKTRFAKIKNIYKKMLLYKIDKITSYQIKIEKICSFVLCFHSFIFLHEDYLIIGIIVTF